MEALTLDQIMIFLAVVDEGSFSKAAKKLNRAQSALTYGIQKLETQTGMQLFDRTAYRVVLTEAGRTLLVRARRIAEEAKGFRDTARSLVSGIEAELSIVLDSLCPMQILIDALRAFSKTFPTVPPRVYVQPLGASTELVLDGTCTMGLLLMQLSDIAKFKRFPLATVDLIPVASPEHPLAKRDGPIETHVLHDHVQLVLSDRSAMTEGRDYGVLSGRTWRLGDLGAKHAMLLAGLGWGNMPAHLVQDDIEQGRLKTIEPADFDAPTSKLVICGAYLADNKLGPAARWMIEHLAALGANVTHRSDD